MPISLGSSSLFSSSLLKLMGFCVLMPVASLAAPNWVSIQFVSRKPEPRIEHEEIALYFFSTEFLVCLMNFGCALLHSNMYIEIYISLISIQVYSWGSLNVALPDDLVMVSSQTSVRHLLMNKVWEQTALEQCSQFSGQGFQRKVWSTQITGGVIKKSARKDIIVMEEAGKRYK